MKRSDRNIIWMESNLKIPSGKHINQPLKLSKFQRKFVRRIYDNPHGTRRAILSIGRKNGKTALSAALLLLHFVGPESRPNSDLFSAARTRDQAGLVYDYAKKMILMSPQLKDHVNLVASQKSMRCESRGTTFKALAADATGAMGLNPAVCIHDELGQVLGPQDAMYDAIESAMGAQEEPLSIIISTQAASDDDLLSILIDDGLAEHDPRVVVELHTADGMEDPFTEEGLSKANPGLYEFMNVSETIDSMNTAKRLPAAAVSFQNLNLNMRVSQDISFVSKQEWDGCIGELPPIEDCEAVYGGLDLSRTRDLTALVFVGVLDGVFYVYPNMWLPKVGLYERSKIQRIPYWDWYKEGYLNVTEGAVINRTDITDLFYHVFENTNFIKLAYDAWDYRNIIGQMVESGFRDWQIDPDLGEKEELIIEMFRQGFISMSPALRVAETLIVKRKLVHPNNPVLNFNLANSKVLFDTSGNRKLDKSNSIKTIDGVVAMIMALTIAWADYHDPGDPNFSLTDLFK